MGNLFLHPETERRSPCSCVSAQLPFFVSSASGRSSGARTFSLSFSSGSAVSNCQGHRRAVTLATEPSSCRSPTGLRMFAKGFKPSRPASEGERYVVTRCRKPAFTSLKSADGIIAFPSLFVYDKYSRDRIFGIGNRMVWVFEVSGCCSRFRSLVGLR